LFLQLILLQISGSQKTITEMNTLISRATSAVATKRIFLIKDYEVVTIPLHLLEIEAAIDSLTYRLISLQYSSDIELTEPRTVVGQNYVSNGKGKFLASNSQVTIFSRVMTLFDSNTICNKIGLKVLELENLPHQLRVPEVLLHFEILVTDGMILCTSASMVKKGMDCVQYLLDKTRHRDFIRTASNLTRTLTTYKNNKFYIKATEDQFLFTHANYGITGCSEDSSSLTMDSDRDLQKNLHAQYFKSLGGLYVSLYKNLNSYVEYMAEAVHQFSTETSLVPPMLVNNSMIIEGIIKLLPTYLPNMDMPRLKFSEFSKFFSEQILLSNDDIIAEFRDPLKLARFKTRQLKIIYSAAEQFNTNTRVRIAKFASHFVDLKSIESIPNSWLIRRDQNSGTFIMLINSIISSIDDNVLHEIYVIVNNRKTSLLRDLSPFSSKQVESTYLKHRELENLNKESRRKVIKLPPSVSTPVPDLFQGDEETFLTNYERFLNNNDPAIENLFPNTTTPGSPLPNFRMESTSVISTTVHQTGPPLTTPNVLQILLNSPVINQESTVPSNVIVESTISSSESSLLSSSYVYPNPTSTLPEEETTPTYQIPPRYLADYQNFTYVDEESGISLADNTPTSQIPEYANISPNDQTTEKSFETLDDIRTYFKNQSPSRVSRTKRSEIRGNKSADSSEKIRTNKLFYESFPLERPKRSGFWTQVFGIATSDDMVEAYRNEIDVSMREDVVEKGMSEVRLKTNELLKNYKSMAFDLQKVETQEKKLFEYVDQIVKAETDSLKKLELLAKSIDRITVMSSEYQNLNLQTILLIHTIEKTHILIQSALSGNVDIAQLPADLLQMYNPNHLQTSLSSTHVEFVYGRSGYSLKLRIPELSDPFIMYDIISIPIYVKNHWTTMNLKRNLIVNSVQDTLEHDSPLSSICEQGKDYFLCNPTELVIRHSQNTCELDIISANGVSRPQYMNCGFDSVKLRADDQYALMVRGNLSLSSMIDDELHYICKNPADSKIKPISAGFTIHEISEGCVYETSKLTIYNGPEKIYLKNYKDTDTELEILNALSTLETLLDDAIISDYSNNSNVEQIVKEYEKIQKETEVTYERLKKDIKIAQEVKQLGEYSPLKIDLRAPAQQSNWLTATFWICIILFSLFILGCACRICPNCFPIIWKSVSLSCAGYWFTLKNCFQIRWKPESNDMNIEAGQAEGFEIVHLVPQAPNSFSSLPSDVVSMNLVDPNMLDRSPAPGLQPRYPNLESHYEESRPYHEWRITKGRHNEYLLTSIVPDGLGNLTTIFYDIVDGQSIDQYNRQLPYISNPSENLIQSYRDKVRNSVSPAYLIENGVMYLPGAPHIIYSTETNHWINRVTKRIISGLNAPNPIRS
jgi:hypothetical protein